MRPFAWVYGAIIGTFLIVMLMLLVNLGFIYAVWPPGTGLSTTTAILAADLEWAPRPLADRLSGWSYGALFEFSGIDAALAAGTTPGAKLNAADNAFVNGLLLPHGETIAILMQSARLIGVRMAILWQVLGIGLVLLVAAIVDGLVQRYVRRESAGRESSGLYHRVKHMQLVGGCLLGMVYITVPVALDPRWLFVWVAGVAGLAFMQAKLYKKYL